MKGIKTTTQWLEVAIAVMLVMAVLVGIVSVTPVAADKGPTTTCVNLQSGNAMQLPSHAADNVEEKNKNVVCIRPSITP
jgi:hypothetical protein